MSNNNREPLYREFVFVFVINSQLNWSLETVSTLPRRIKNKEDCELIMSFAKDGDVGSFITLDSNALIFRQA